LKQTITALGWISRLIWIAVILLPVTFGLSMEKLFQPDAIGFGEATSSFSNNKICISLPFYINNTGYYDISHVNLTTVLKDKKGETVAQGETFILAIRVGSKVDASHNIYVSLDKLSEEMEYLLFNDTMLDLNASLSLRFAQVIGIALSTNLTVPWGAPIHNLTLSGVTYDPVTQKLCMSLTFENHSPLTVKGDVQMIIYNAKNETIGSQYFSLEVPSNSLFAESLEISIDIWKVTENGYVFLYFGTEEFTAGPIKKEWSLVE